MSKSSYEKIDEPQKRSFSSQRPVFERFEYFVTGPLNLQTESLKTNMWRSQETIRLAARPVRGRFGAGAWRGGQGIEPSAGGGETVLHAWSVCTRGPRG